MESSGPIAPEPRLSLWRQLAHPLTLLPLATLAAFLILVAAGLVEIRLPAKAQSWLAGRARGPYVERTDADRYFKMLGWEASVFRYNGAFVDCRVEVETDGKTKTVGEGIGRRTRSAAAGSEPPVPGASPRGHILWVRRQDEGSGTEPGPTTWYLQITIEQKGREETSPGARELFTLSSLKTAHGGIVDGVPAGKAVELQPGREVVLDSIQECEFEEGKPIPRRVSRLICKLLPATDPKGEK